MKSRGVYETPGGTILFNARRAVESLTLDKGAQHLKDELMPRYAELVYNGFWFAPEREMLQAAIDESQKVVTGTVPHQALQGQRHGGRPQVAEQPLFGSHRRPSRKTRSTTRSDATGFIKLNALRLRLRKQSAQ